MVGVSVLLYLYQMWQEGSISREVKEEDDPLELRVSRREKAR
ncbi:hypothetical protein [Paenibacillus hamazuiensis]|nr:hypothetical protein [Paenibacillus hamazuiensis]